ncbi:5307_t:CDS:2 [Funneliformis caledonium]|uniref:5307_t:CDS:1 n=1 Tax=Funneliformis caledonium TaxID=1117310 RepID=A0A9N9CVI3_9GLOM|nr:5307_t:CDS:2 [Funneliformis caledonium]
MIHIGFIRQRNLRDRLNATCEKGKYASELVPVKLEMSLIVLCLAKNDRTLLEIRVGIVLYKVLIHIKRKNITPPNPELKKMKSKSLSSNDANFQLSAPETVKITPSLPSTSISEKPSSKILTETKINDSNVADIQPSSQVQKMQILAFK